MTHEKLLAKIDEEIKCAEFEERCGDGGWSAGAKALRAVVELHKEYVTSDGSKFCVICTRTEDEWEYPCPTIQAIEKELR